MPFITGELDAATRQLEQRTGRPMEEWVTLARREGPLSRKDRLNWLREAYGLELSEAEAVQVQGEKEGAFMLDDASISELFTGDAARAWPLFVRLTAIFRTFGRDITAQRDRDSVVFYRNWPFAAAKPVEDGLLAGAAIPGGVEVRNHMEHADGSEDFPKRIDHKVFIGILDDFEGELVRLFREAYESS